MSCEQMKYLYEPGNESSNASTLSHSVVFSMEVERYPGTLEAELREGEIVGFQRFQKFPKRGQIMRIQPYVYRR